jgi:hypothetical protein
MKLAKEILINKKVLNLKIINSLMGINLQYKVLKTFLY